MNKILNAAEKKRHLYLLGKLQKGETLGQRELSELRKYESNQSDVKKTELESQRMLMARKRAEARVIEFGKVADWKRRNKCKDNPELFCKTYFPELFFNPFTQNQRDIIESITQRLTIGGYQAIAAERGSGKTTIIKVVGAIWAVLYGHIQYIILIRANGRESKEMLADIKSFYQESAILAADFPEVIACIDGLEDTAQKAKKQTAKPEGSDLEPTKTNIKWTEDTITLPDVMMYDAKDKLIKSVSSKAIITTRGIDGSIRGAVKGKMRPDLVILDDIETRETADSDKQKADIKHAIQKDIAGLAGTKKKMPIVYIGTIISKDCITDWLTDKSKSPAWNGIKQKRVTKFPDNEDLWQKYMQVRKNGQVKGDLTGRASHQFYLENKANMDAGAVISNEYRYVDTKLEDGSLLEVSALEAVYNDICDMGMDAFKSEYQNEPVDLQIELNKVAQNAISSKLNGQEKGKTSNGKVTVFIDIHDSLLYWVAVEWQPLAVGRIIDYDATWTELPQRGTISESQRRDYVDIHILETLRGLREKFKAYNPALVLIDSGYKPQIIYAFCKESIGLNYVPSKGGSGRGGIYTTPKPSQTTKMILGTCHHSYQVASGIWIAEFNPNHYKLQVHNGFMTTDINAAGSLSFYGNSSFVHDAIAEQIVSEAWNSELKRFVVVTNFGNHYLDCLAGNCLAAHILGITPVAKPIYTRPKPQIQSKSGGFLSGVQLKF